jgi:hypothetical protein
VVLRLKRSASLQGHWADSNRKAASNQSEHDQTKSCATGVHAVPGPNREFVNLARPGGGIGTQAFRSGFFAIS